MKNLMWELLTGPNRRDRLLTALRLMTHRLSDSHAWLNQTRTVVHIDDVTFTQKGTTLHLEFNGRVCVIDASAVLTTHSLEEVVLHMRQCYGLEPNPQKYKIYEYEGNHIYTADFELDILFHYAMAANGFTCGHKNVPTGQPCLHMDVDQTVGRGVFYTLHSEGRSIVRWHVGTDNVIHTTVGKLSGPNALPFYSTDSLPDGAVYLGESDNWGFGSA